MNKIERFTTLRSLWVFGALARDWALGPRTPDITLRVHPATFRQIAQEGALDPGAPPSCLGIPLDVDLRVPAGVLRLLYRGEEIELPVDLAAAQPPHDPPGGLCDARAVCSGCDWTWDPPESTKPADALALGNWCAQEHRASTGHCVLVSVEVSWAARPGR